MTSVLVALEEGQSLWIIGSARIQVLSGRVETLGTTIRSSSSCSYSSIIPILSSTSSSFSSFVIPTSSSSGTTLSTPSLSTTMNSITSSSTIVSLPNLPTTATTAVIPSLSSYVTSTYDIVSSPYDGALQITSTNVQDLRLLASNGYAYEGTVLYQRLEEEYNNYSSSSSSNEPLSSTLLRRTVLRISCISQLNHILNEYDTTSNESGIVNSNNSHSLPTWATSIRGALLLTYNDIFRTILPNSTPSIGSMTVTKLVSSSSSSSPTDSNNRTNVVGIVIKNNMVSNIPVPLNSNGKEINATFSSSSSSSSQRRKLTIRSIHPLPSWIDIVNQICMSIVPSSNTINVPNMNNSKLIDHKTQILHGNTFLPVIMVVGPKGSGKSTFVRYLVNRLLSLQDQQMDERIEHEQQSSLSSTHISSSLMDDICREYRKGVTFLDLDPGQPEHTPPGLISLSHLHHPLLIPPYLHSHHSIPLIDTRSTDISFLPEAESCTPTISVTPTLTNEQRLSYRNPELSSVPAPSHLLTDPNGVVIASRYIGSNSVNDDPMGFVLAAADLVNVYRTSNNNSKASSNSSSTLSSESQSSPASLCSRSPLVINGHGWMTGFGYETLQSLLSFIAPTHLIVLENTNTQSSSFHRRNISSYTQPLPISSNSMNNSSTGHDYDNNGMMMVEMSSNNTTNLPSTINNVEILTAPTVAWQPSPLFGTLKRLPSVTYPLPAWYNDPMILPNVNHSSISLMNNSSLLTNYNNSSNTANNNNTNGPPRAVRSPAELRGARLLTYLLSNLRYPNIDSLYSTLPSSAMESSTESSSTIIDNDAGEDNEDMDTGINSSNGNNNNTINGTRKDKIVPEGSIVSITDPSVPNKRIHSDYFNDKLPPSTSLPDDSGFPGPLQNNNADSTNDMEEGANDDDEEEDDRSLSSVSIPSMNDENDGLNDDSGSDYEDDDDDTDSELASLATLDLGTLSTKGAAQLYYKLIRHLAYRTFWSVLADTRIARTCVKGILSPAWYAMKSLCLKVPAVDMYITKSSNEFIPYPLHLEKNVHPQIKEFKDNITSTIDQPLQSIPGILYIPLSIDQHNKCKSIEGKIVGLSSTVLYHKLLQPTNTLPSLTELATKSTPTIRLSLEEQFVNSYRTNTVVSNTMNNHRNDGILYYSTRLPCLGIGYVRHYDSLRGILHILSPLPIEYTPFIDTLVPWNGAHDIPVNLLYRDAAEGDPFCYHPADIVSTFLAKAKKSGQVRKNLKRKRLQPK